MTLAQVHALRRLLVDPLERERLRRDVEVLLGARHVTMPAEVEVLVASLNAARHSPRDSLQLARQSYVDALLAIMDDGKVERGLLAQLANVSAALAVLAGRDHEARRWLRIAEVEATADGLDGREVALAWWRAVEVVTRGW